MRTLIETVGCWVVIFCTFVALVGCDLLGDVLDLQKQLHPLDGGYDGLGYGG